jgi:uncharacterized protein
MFFIVFSVVLSLIAVWVLRRSAPAFVRSRPLAALAGGVVLLHALWWLALRPDGPFSEPLAQLISNVAAIWLSLTLTLIVLAPLLLLPPLRPRRAPEPGRTIGRRQFLKQAAVPALALGLSGAATLPVLAGRFRVRHQRIDVPGLHPSLDGFRIGQMADTHVGYFLDAGDVEAAVRTLDAEGVHLQVMVGDLIDDLTQMEACLDALEQCQAPLGMVAVLGNHEKWVGEAQVVSAFQQRADRLPLLVDCSIERAFGDASIRITGVDYPMETGGRHSLPRDVQRRFMEESARKAYAGSAPADLNLCLTHHPEFFPVAARHGADLTLAGHTHGGQIAFLGQPLFGFAFQYMLGHYRKGRHHLFVTGGTGDWLPIRLGVPREVVVLTLRRV